MDILNEINFFNQCESTVKTLNHNQLQELLNTIYGNIFWHKKKASFSKTTNLQAALLKRLSLYCTKLLDNQLAPLEINDNGVRIDREFTGLTTQQYDSLLSSKRNWKPFLNLESYHCYWINNVDLKIICYCEGDLITRTAINNEMLMLEKDSIIQWHKDNE